MTALEQVSTGEEWNRDSYFYSQAIRIGDLLFVSGQAALDGDGNIVGLGDFDAQAEQVFSNLDAVLRAGGSNLDQVAKVTIFMTDMSYFDRIIQLRERFFTPPYPADTTVEVRALALAGLMLEIEAIAVVTG
jgi:2-iminobutanoate/2-iminopropanoate deaminase